MKLRRQLSSAGLDAGPDTIHWHLEHHHATTVSVSSIARTLTRAGLVTPEPKKRPRSFYIRFEAELVRLRIVQKNSRPNHPTTCGKVERFQQTLKRWLDQQPAPTTLTELLRDLTLDTTRDYQPTGAPKGPTRPKKKRPEPS